VSKVIILGSGAAPGVPALSNGFGDCDPHNPKNIRLRTGTYYEINGVKFLIDTSPDLRTQLIQHNIRRVDAVLYTHTHADHLHGIDDLRELNRISGQSIDVYASKNNMAQISVRFDYLMAKTINDVNPMYRASLMPHTFEYGQAFDVKGVKVTPILLQGHNIEVTGYVFNDGEAVHIADFHTIPQVSLQEVKVQPKIMIMPLTTTLGTKFHAGMADLLRYTKELNPKQVIINHMATECDYEAVKQQCLNNMQPAYDGLTLEW